MYVLLPDIKAYIIKAGMDDIIFKIYDMNHYVWEVECVKYISNKGGGKGNTKVAFADEVKNIGGNNIY